MEKPEENLRNVKVTENIYVYNKMCMHARI